MSTFTFRIFIADNHYGSLTCASCGHLSCDPFHVICLFSDSDFAMDILRSHRWVQCNVMLLLTSSFMMIYPLCSFIHVHLTCVALNSVQYYKMVPYVS
jgi:hypothetical protein